MRTIDTISPAAFAANQKIIGALKRALVEWKKERLDASIGRMLESYLPDSYYVAVRYYPEKWGKFYSLIIRDTELPPARRGMLDEYASEFNSYNIYVSGMSGTKKPWREQLGNEIQRFDRSAEYAAQAALPGLSEDLEAMAAEATEMKAALAGIYSRADALLYEKLGGVAEIPRSVERAFPEIWGKK